MEKNCRDIECRNGGLDCKFLKNGYCRYLHSYYEVRQVKKWLTNSKNSFIDHSPE